MDIWNKFSDLAVTIFDNQLMQILLVILAVSIIQLIIRRTIGKVIRSIVKSHKFTSPLEEKKREDTLIHLLGTASAVVLWTIGIIVILAILKVNIAAIMTGAGLIGIVVGFGAQSAIKDFLAGIFIIAENQYRVGDIVTLYASGNEISGVVEEITIRITRLRDLDGNVYTVPNGSTAIVNNRTFEYANVNIDVGVAYESDVDVVEKVINEVGDKMAEDKEWKEFIVEPIHFLRVDGFEDSAVRIKSLGRVKPAKQWDVAGEFRRRVKKAFEANGVTIPFPQVVLHQDKK